MPHSYISSQANAQNVDINNKISIKLFHILIKFVCLYIYSVSVTMGGGVSSAFDLYGAERNRLHKSLITSFVDDPMNAQIVKSIFRLKEVLSQHPHICAVAARESVNNYLPTCLQSAQIEYNRLLALYEEHMHLKSSLHRTGFVACPLGHQTEKVTKGNCNVCGHASQSGYICSFCEYYMCELCSFIYCEGEGLY